MVDIKKLVALVKDLAIISKKKKKRVRKRKRNKKKAKLLVDISGNNVRSDSSGMIGYSNLNTEAQHLRNAQIEEDLKYNKDKRKQDDSRKKFEDDTITATRALYHLIKTPSNTTRFNSNPVIDEPEDDYEDTFPKVTRQNLDRNQFYNVDDNIDVTGSVSSDEFKTEGNTKSSNSYMSQAWSNIKPYLGFIPDDEPTNEDPIEGSDIESNIDFGDFSSVKSRSQFYPSLADATINDSEGVKMNTPAVLSSNEPNRYSGIDRNPTILSRSSAQAHVDDPFSQHIFHTDNHSHKIENKSKKTTGKRSEDLENYKEKWREAGVPDDWLSSATKKGVRERGDYFLRIADLKQEYRKLHTETKSQSDINKILRKDALEILAEIDRLKATQVLDNYTKK